MNNKFSDIDKIIITAWLFFGAGVGVFLAPLFQISFWVSGAIGLVAGVFVDYVLFFEPWRRKYGLFAYSEQAADDPAEAEETDLSEFIRDSFAAEDIVSQDEIEFRNDDDGDPDMLELEEHAEENVEEHQTLQVASEDEINDEIDESDVEFDVIEVDKEALKEAEMEEDELEEQRALPALYGRENQIHSSYDRYESNELRGDKAWMKPTPLLMILAGIWFLISNYISANYPEAMGSIMGDFPSWFFTFLPIFFLIGLSGLIGILFRERDETLEMSSKENAAHLFNLVKIFTGWGIGLYAILVNL